jgi:hypothetical protein
MRFNIRRTNKVEKMERINLMFDAIVLREGEGENLLRGEIK